jgi:hypothetical protein
MSKIIGKSRQPFNSSFDVDFLSFLDHLHERKGIDRNALIVEAVQNYYANDLKIYRMPVKRSLFKKDA